MEEKHHFSEETLAAVRKSMVIGLRAGTKPHRFIGIWAVVVENRVFIRSWSLKAKSWYRVFQEEPQGTAQIDGQEFAVRAVQNHDEGLLDAIDRAYLEKYKTPGSIKYAQDLGRPESRVTTTELVPVSLDEAI
jgi:hypothetical protein